MQSKQYQMNEEETQFMSNKGDLVLMLQKKSELIDQNFEDRLNNRRTLRSNHQNISMQQIQQERQLSHQAYKDLLEYQKEYKLFFLKSSELIIKIRQNDIQIFNEMLTIEKQRLQDMASSEISYQTTLQNIESLSQKILKLQQENQRMDDYKLKVEDKMNREERQFIEDEGRSLLQMFYDEV